MNPCAAQFPVSCTQSAQKVMRNGAPDDAVFVADVALGSSGSLDAALKGADALIIATSAVPQVRSLARAGARFKYTVTVSENRVRTCDN